MDEIRPQMEEHRCRHHARMLERPAGKAVGKHSRERCLRDELEIAHLHHFEIVCSPGFEIPERAIDDFYQEQLVLVVRIENEDSCCAVASEFAENVTGETHQ